MRIYRVVVADDDPTFRSAAVEVLEADERFAVVGEVATGSGLVESCRTPGRTWCCSTCACQAVVPPPPSS